MFNGTATTNVEKQYFIGSGSGTVTNTLVDYPLPQIPGWTTQIDTKYNNVSSILMYLASGVSVEGITIQPRNHNSKAIKIKNIEIKKGE